MLFGGKSFIKSYVKARMLTHDPEQAARYEGDPLISRSIATNVLLDLPDLSTRLLIRIVDIASGPGRSPALPSHCKSAAT